MTARTEMDVVDRIGGTFEDEGTRSDQRYNAYDRRSRCRIMRLFLQGQPRDLPLMDLGCSIGAWAFFYQEEGYRGVVGADISHRRLLTARSRGYHPVCANGVALPIRSATLHTVVCLDVLVHVLNPDRQQRIFHEVARILRPGGLFIFSVPNVRGYRLPPERQVIEDCVYMTAQEAEEFARGADLRIEDVRGIQFIESLRFLWRVTPHGPRYRFCLPFLDAIGSSAFREHARLLFFKTRKPS